MAKDRKLTKRHFKNEARVENERKMKYISNISRLRQKLQNKTGYVRNDVVGNLGVKIKKN
jgi:hypothetical protein